MSKDLSAVAQRPSETSDGKRWLGNFSAGERIAATLLVDSLEIHNHATAINTLRDQLISDIEAGTILLPAVLVPILSQDELPPLSDRPFHVAYETFQPGDLLSALPGSEAEIASMIAILVKSKPNQLLPATLSLDEMRARRVRTLVLLTDYCGSGTQASRFVENFTKNKTVASWISMDRMSIRVHAYAAAEPAAEKIASQTRATLRKSVTAKTARFANWSTEERNSIKELCRTHADPLQIDDLPALGYKDSFGLYLSTLRAPNNLPQILVRVNGAWPGIFEDRQVSSTFSKELGSYLPGTELVRTLRNHGGQALADRLEKASRPVRGIRAIAALHLLASGFSENEIRELFASSDDDWRKLRTSLISLDLIDLNLNVTEGGWAELARTEMPVTSRIKRDSALTSPLEYVPTQLR